jgi:hypothetical protein
MSGLDWFVTLAPPLFTYALAGGLVQAARTMAPRGWAYWLALVFAACCLVLPLRYGPGFLPDDLSKLGTNRALLMDFNLAGAFSAVAAALSVRAMALARILGRRGFTARIMLALSLTCAPALLVLLANTLRKF